jgi:hypothetical protein
MELQELKRYAIEHRAEIKFGDPRTNRECLISVRGLAKIPGENKDFRVEDLLEAAESFEIIGSNGNTQRYSREAMARIIAEREKGSGGHHEEEEE